MALRVATRFAASQDVTPEHLEAIVKVLDANAAPDATTRLQQLVRSLRNDAIAPFPVTELGEYLRSRGVDEDEVTLVETTKVKAPKTTKSVDFVDAFLAMGREMGVSVVPDMKFENDPEAGKAVSGWVAGFKKLKPKARQVWSQYVKKVHLGGPMGSEDASWRSGGVMHLSIHKSYDAKVRTTQLTHELGHAFEETHRVDGPPWGSPPFISDYAEHKPGVEDVAESFRAYLEEPQELKRKCPEKFEALKKLV